jgi:hypothetical protein
VVNHPRRAAHQQTNADAAEVLLVNGQLAAESKPSDWMFSLPTDKGKG